MMNTNLKAEFYFIRHGETERNVNSDLIGQSGTEPLNEKGKAQAILLGLRFKNDNLKFDYVYTSPYNRAVDTCTISCGDMLKSIPSTTVSALRELDQGDGIGKSRKELYTPEFKEHLEVMGMGFKFPNGECLYEVEHRAKKWLEKEILDNPFMPTDRLLKIGIFSHGMTIKGLLHYVMKFDPSFTWRVNLENTSITRLTLYEGTWFLGCINDHSHLIRG